MNTITANKLFSLLDSDDSVTLLDVRTPAEHCEIHIDGARLTPLESLNPVEINAALPKGATCVICRSGTRAKSAIEKLQNAGVEDLILLEGGILAWDSAGLPVNRGKRKVLPLDRQMRITAGSLALIGTVLGFAIHPYWHGLSGFIGAGLIFAGITDICPLSMLIAKMPWNQNR